jgi:hypothetical protein
MGPQSPNYTGFQCRGADSRRLNTQVPAPSYHSVFWAHGKQWHFPGDTSARFSWGHQHAAGMWFPSIAPAWLSSTPVSRPSHLPFPLPHTLPGCHMATPYHLDST